VSLSPNQRIAELSQTNIRDMPGEIGELLKNISLLRHLSLSQTKETTAALFVDLS